MNLSPTHRSAASILRQNPGYWYNAQAACTLHDGTIVTTDFETIIIGGGLVGAAVACGLVKKSSSIAILDGEDTDFRASRGNFGLIWVQGKGADYSPYAQWSGIGGKMWPIFEQELREATGIDVGYEQTGGLDFCLNETEWEARSEEMRQVSQHTQGSFEYRMLVHKDLKQKIPQISDQVLGASFSSQDGHVNPLYLLRAMHQQAISAGCEYRPGTKVISIRADGSGFALRTDSGVFTAARVLLCAGLDNQRLGQDLDLLIPVNPVRGQLLITERTQPFMPCASLQVRQTREGSLQIGDSHEFVDFNDDTTLDVITMLARRAVKIFPHLKDIKLVRAWGALRIMTPDGVPVYQESESHPGAFGLSCHSGVSLAAVHANLLPDWILGEYPHQLISHFSSDRFNVSPA